MMNIIKRIKRMTLGLMLASVPLLGGCGGNTLTWTEEVKLLDGRVITVTQKWQYDRDRMPRDYKLTFKLAEFGDKEITWNENLMPQVLNVYQGKLYVVGIPFGEAEFIQYGKPFPEYVPYRYEAGQWQRIPFNEIPETIYDTNMWIDSEPENGAKHISLSDKAREMQDDRLRAYFKKITPTFKRPQKLKGSGSE
jgi:hypothetical protein